MDVLIFHYLNNLGLKYFWLDVLAIFLAKYTPYLAVGVLFLLLFWNFKNYFLPVVESLTAAVLGMGIVKIIRFLWFNPRPFVSQDIHLLLSHSSSSSFPSMHVTFFFALSTVVLLYSKKAGILFFITSFLIALARVFVGLHWPSDILGGMVLGTFSALIVHKFLIKRIFG